MLAPGSPLLGRLYAKVYIGAPLAPSAIAQTASGFLQPTSRNGRDRFGVDPSRATDQGNSYSLTWKIFQSPLNVHKTCSNVLSAIFDITFVNELPFLKVAVSIMQRLSPADCVTTVHTKSNALILGPWTLMTTAKLTFSSAVTEAAPSVPSQSVS